jgi:LmbE family N-acetylglucosaminyl deacetylase
MLAQTGLVGATFVAGLPATAAVGSSSAAELPARQKLKVVVAGGHPGDPEYGCGGTIARFTDLGHNVALLYLNQGEWDSTPATTRLAEAAKACEILKARPVYAGQRNGHAVVDESHYDEFAKILQGEEPDVVFTQWPIDNHRDHRATAMLAYDAWRKLGRRFSLYYYEVSNGEDTLQFSPTHYVDISNVERRKRAACYAHASQTPDRYYELQDLVARFRGIESGHKRSEAFVLQVKSPHDVLTIFTAPSIR